MFEDGAGEIAAYEGKEHGRCGPHRRRRASCSSRNRIPPQKRRRAPPATTTTSPSAQRVRRLPPEMHEPFGNIFATDTSHLDGTGHSSQVLAPRCTPPFSLLGIKLRFLRSERSGKQGMERLDIFDDERRRSPWTAPCPGRGRADPQQRQSE